MRRKGDEGGKPGREQHGEEGTGVGKLKWGCSAGGTDGVRARTGPTQLLWVGKHHQLQQQFLHRAGLCTTNSLLFWKPSISTPAFDSDHGPDLHHSWVSKLYGLLALGRLFLKSTKKKKNHHRKLEEFGHKWVCRKVTPLSFPRLPLVVVSSLQTHSEISSILIDHFPLAFLCCVYFYYFLIRLQTLSTETAKHCLWFLVTVHFKCILTQCFNFKLNAN